VRTTVTFRFFTMKIKAQKGRYRKARVFRRYYKRNASGMRVGNHKLEKMKNRQNHLDENEFKERQMNSLKGYLGETGCGDFIKGKTRVKDFERTINMPTKQKWRKPAKPNDMNSYNLLKTLGLSAVKPEYKEFCNQTVSLYSCSNKGQSLWKL